ncbi:hypothetical protein LXA43DRAFT_303904 [Ganoderma leucocontextum]|nr:hypothetical protein LXA43DRAFT_303904 [Ganoderma leucocontextum]
MASPNLFPSDPSRLPSYRSTHVGRFHPYPRSTPRRGEDALMQTVDYRTVDHITELATIPEQPEHVHLRPLVVCQEVPDGDVSSLELDYPVVGDASFFEQAVRAEDDVGEKVKAAVAHLLVALRRRSLALWAVLDFLKGERRSK